MSVQATKYACLMLKLPIKKWDVLTNAIKSEDLWTKIDHPGFGRELEPHVTILYGFHDSVQPTWIKDCVYTIQHPIVVELKAISHFENPLFDALKFDIHSPKLQKLHEIFSKFPNTPMYPKYQPHATIAYVKKGLAEKYHRTLNKPIIVESNIFIYSQPHGKTWQWENDKKIDINSTELWFSMPGNRI
jgi:2'-5' RNA ligase